MSEPLLDDYDYDLPPERIAQEPSAKRDESRLLVVHRDGGNIEHRLFRDIVGLFREGDVLVINDTRVIPARLRARKESGAAVEMLLVEPFDSSEGAWLVMGRPGKAFRSITPIRVVGNSDVVVRTLDRQRELFVVSFERDGERLTRDEVIALGDRLGETPLPPYIHRGPGEGRRSDDRERYQTVYARKPGAVAAPTAGLHFTREILAELEAKGVERVSVTLHVGLDTFRPLTEEAARGEELHGERVSIESDAAERLVAARESGRRIVAVGTTTTRVLESFAAAGSPVPYEDRTRLFIRPPYEFAMVDALVTNFHLPRSSLLMMVSALVGRERLLEIYREAIDREYRFYSYGDAMIIL